MKCQALSQHTRHTLVVTDMLLQRFTIYHTRRCFLAFTSLHSIGSDLCPSSQALIHEDKTPAPPLHSYALIGQPARPRRACSQCARGVSGALGGSSVRSGSAARAQYNEENTASPHRATLAKGVKEKERESLHLKTSHHIWRGSPQPGGGTRDLIYTVTFFFCVFFISFLGEGLWAFACKDDGRGDGGEWETEAESRLSHAVTEREEAHDEFTKPERDLHTPGETFGRR